MFGIGWLAAASILAIAGGAGAGPRFQLHGYEHEHGLHPEGRHVRNASVGLSIRRKGRFKREMALFRCQYLLPFTIDFSGFSKNVG